MRADDGVAAALLVAGPGLVTGAGESGGAAVGELLPGRRQHVEGFVECDEQGLGIALAHRVHQGRGRRRNPRAVSERAGGETEREITTTGARQGQRFGEQMGEMGHPRDRRVVFPGLGGYDDGAAVEREVGDLPPHLGIGAVVDGDHPHRVAEQLGGACGPSGLGRSCHGVSAHETSRQAVCGDGSGHFGLDAHHVGECDIGCMFGHRLEDAAHRRHRHRDHHQGVGVGCATQRGGEVGGGVEAVGDSSIDDLRGAVVAPCLSARRRGGAQQRTTDQAETEDTDGRGGHG